MLSVVAPVKHPSPSPWPYPLEKLVMDMIPTLSMPEGRKSSKIGPRSRTIRKESLRPRKQRFERSLPDPGYAGDLLLNIYNCIELPVKMSSSGMGKIEIFALSIQGENGRELQGAG